MKAELTAFSPILTAQYRSVKNYLAHRLDRITKVELAVFLGVLSYDLFSRFIAHLDRLIGSEKLAEVWQLYIGLSKGIIILLFVSGFAFARRKLGDIRFSLLLIQPLPDATLAAAKLLAFLIPFVLLLPFWLIVPSIVLVKLSVQWDIVVLQMLFQVAAYLASALLGIAGALAAGERRRHPGTVSCILSAACLTALCALALIPPWPQNPSLSVSLAFFTMAALYLALCYAAVRESLVKRILFSPDALWQSLPHKRRRKGYPFLLSAYLYPVPGKLAPLVRKDVLFVARSYKTFLIVFLAFLFVTLGAILRSGDSRNAAQWLISLSIAASYFLANAAFKFNDEGIERLQVIKSHPVSAGRHWWSKFWVGFLPCLWLILVGHFVLALRHFPGWLGMLQSLALSLFVAVTLVFIENNFALYSYPYARYAPLWYNLYIITAVVFFTVLLFPPLAIVFLLFGYYAIFRVQRRMDAIEVLT